MLLQTLRFGLILSIAFGCDGQRPGNFVVIGPGGGGAMFNPTISPHDANTVLVSCDMTGSYITHDGGQSWRMFNLRGTVKFFAFDPKDPQVIYAETRVLWRSQDGGLTWKLVYPSPSSVKGVQMNSDHAEETLIAEPDPLGSITALAIDPDTSRTLYAAASKASENGLFVSRDSGQTWRREASLPEAALHVWVDPRAARDARTLTIACPHSIYVKTVSGMKTHAAPESAAFIDLSAGFQGSLAMIYGVTKKGAFVSSDGGTSWHNCTLPGRGARVRAVATSLHHASTAYLSYNHLELDGQKWDGVAKTTNAGRSWTLSWKDGRETGTNIHDAWVSERFGPGWGENPLMLGVAEDNPNLCYTTDLGRTMKTADGGATWTAVYSRRNPGRGWTSTGLDVTTNYGISFDPFDMRRQFITYTDIGLFRSEDGGKSWVSSTDGVPGPWVNTTYWMVFDPDVRGRAWSVNSGTHDLPRPKMWRNASVLNYKGGVCRSDDGGKTWAKSNSGMEETAATHILLDPRSSPEARTLYVAAFGRGVYKSTDGGKTWNLKNTGIRQKEPFAWRLAQASDGALYVLVARRSEDGIGNDGDGAIYRSADGAEHWSAVSMPGGVNAPNGLAIDPKFLGRLYLAAWARATGMHGEGGGIYVSDDAGRKWRQVLDRDQHVYDVTVDPRDSKVLFAAGFESSAWRSTDRGEHWSRIAGFNFKWGHRVIPDPLENGSVYVTTFGGGVWHGSVNGRPKPLDIVTPILEPGELQ
ncbi:MAG: WD40/YVTN/BNR-like repeat-containing protein [Bryobacteraceae bacterium]